MAKFKRSTEVKDIEALAVMTRDVIQEQTDAFDKRFDALLQHVDERMDSVDSAIAKAQETLDTHSGALDALIKATKVLQEEQAARDQTFRRYEHRFTVIAKKLGLNLHEIDGDI